LTDENLHYLYEFSNRLVITHTHFATVIRNIVMRTMFSAVIANVS
jgi:hypothetical protein